MLARIPLPAVILVTTVVSLVVMVFLILGVPMAGMSSTIFATVFAGSMTILLALAFSHGGPAEAKH
jgi:hypothetical protein